MTTSVMDSAKTYMSGFRVPDLKKLWYGSPISVDSTKPPTPLLLQFEAHVVRLQELSLWTDPKSSLAALATIHGLYWYLSITTSSPFSLAVWLAIVTFVYTTWTQRIWPEIRVPEADPGLDPDWTPVSPDVLSAPELVKIWDDLKMNLKFGFNWLLNLRTNEPGKFCCLASVFFLILAYIGSFITALGLFYYLSVGYLTIPGALRILVKYPAVHCLLQTMEDMRSESPKKDIPKPALVAAEEPQRDATLVENVYATLQSGLNVVSSFNIKAGLASSEANDDLTQYLPEDNEASQSILESAMNSSTRDPMQAHILDQDEVADSSLEYASLLPVSGSLMPDDELDSMMSPMLPTLTHKTEDDDEEEFLPSSTVSQSRSLTKFEDDDEEDDEDEFAASLMAAAAQEVTSPVEVPTVKPCEEEESSSVIRRRRMSPESDNDNFDDFEMISEEELAEVSP